MDRIPLPGAEPLLDECGAALRVAAIRRDAMEVGLTLQQFAHWLRVGDRNGVADEQTRAAVRLGLQWRREGRRLRLSVMGVLGVVEARANSDESRSTWSVRGN